MTLNPRIYIGPLEAVANALVAHRPSHIVSLLDQASMSPTPDGILSEHHLKLSMNDISSPREDLVAPSQAHVEQLIAFVRTWDQRSPILIHCWLGISRSTAAAFITLCTLNGDGVAESNLARKVRTHAPYAAPNPLLVAFADNLLGREGRMSAAINALGPSVGTRSNLVALPVHS